VSAEPVDELTCQEFVELVTELIEGTLADAARAGADEHLAGCEGCEAYSEQVRQTIAALRALAAGDDFPRTRERALASFRELRAG
jgi:anti-sigma factor RsiW